jgi:hypothetical protein
VELSFHPTVIDDSDEGVAVKFVGAAGVEGNTGGGVESAAVAHEAFENGE